MVELVGSFIVVCVVLILLGGLNVRMGALALAGVFLIAYQVYKSTKQIRPLYDEHSRFQTAAMGQMVEFFAGAKVIKVHVAESRQTSRFTDIFKVLATKQIETAEVISKASLITILSHGSIALAITCLGVFNVSRGIMSVGEFVSFLTLLAVLVSPISQVVNGCIQLMDSLGGIERMQELLSMRPENIRKRENRGVWTIRGHVRFDRVCFSYTEGMPALEDVSFDAAPGSTTAIVGRSGSGKTTILNLLAGFYAPSGGRILVDGLDITTVRLSDYRKLLGVVFQDCFLFDDTVEENLRLANPSATSIEIKRACEQARIAEFIESLPEGYSTRVGQRGARFSAGQRQRLSIARAFISNSQIVLLDEMTSNLDVESERLVHEGLDALRKQRTTFIVAHRLSTVCGADQVIALDRGRIQELGSHSSLLSARGLYWKLCNASACASAFGHAF